MATTAKHTWTDFAELVSSSGDKTWKVQQNEEGQFRCSCPSYIFCKAVPRGCKHTRRCEQQRLEEMVKVGQPVAVAPPLLTEAQAIFDAMCVAATKASRINTKDAIGKVGGTAMVDLLRARLAVWAPGAAMEAPAAAGVVTGIRRITFDD